MTTGTVWLFIICCLKRLAEAARPLALLFFVAWVMIQRNTRPNPFGTRSSLEGNHDGMMGWETDCSLPFADDFSIGKLVVGYRNSLRMVCFPPSWKVVSWPMKFLHSSLVVPVTLTMKPISFFKFKRGPYKCVSESSSVLLVVVLSSAQMNIILWADELQLHVYTWLHVRSFAHGCTFVIICVTTTYHYYRPYIFTYLHHKLVGPGFSVVLFIDFPSRQGRVIICWASVRSHCCLLKRWHWNDRRRRKAARRRRHWRDETAMTPDLETFVDLC